MDNKITNWFKRHSKELCLGIVTAIGGATLLAIHIINKNNINNNDMSEIKDYGRDCTMKFILDETGEELGEVKCTESFVNDMMGKN